MTPMMIVGCPAKYRRFIEERIQTALAEVRRDVDYRSDEDERIRALAPVPDALLDATASSDVAVLVVPMPVSELSP